MKPTTGLHYSLIMLDIDRSIGLERRYHDPILDSAPGHDFEVIGTNCMSQQDLTATAGAVVLDGISCTVEDVATTPTPTSELSQSPHVARYTSMAEQVLARFSTVDYSRIGILDVPGHDNQEAHFLKSIRTKFAYCLTDLEVLQHNGGVRGASKYRLDPDWDNSLSAEELAVLVTEMLHDEKGSLESLDHTVHTLGTTALAEAVDDVEESEVLDAEIVDFPIDDLGEVVDELIEIPTGGLHELGEIEVDPDLFAESTYDDGGEDFADYDQPENEHSQDGTPVDSSSYRSLDRIHGSGLSGSSTQQHRTSVSRLDRTGYVGFPDPEPTVSRQTGRSLDLWGINGFLGSSQVVPDGSSMASEHTYLDDTLAMHRSGGHKRKISLHEDVTGPTDEELAEIERETEEKDNFIKYGNCLGVDTDLFFPERGASTKEAKGVCQGCVVREDCLEYALSNGEKFGIWGGLSERERRRIRRQRSLTRAAQQARIS